LCGQRSGVGVKAQHFKLLNIGFGLFGAAFQALSEVQDDRFFASIKFHMEIF
jgi:hypothetical protein